MGIAGTGYMINGEIFIVGSVYFTAKRQHMFTSSRIKAVGTLIIFGVTAITLVWDHYHGGVPAHHLLQDKNMPAVSNWWGLLVMPLLGWITLGKMEARLTNNASRFQEIRLLAIGCLAGILVAVSFAKDFKPILENVPYGLLVLALFFPLYRSAFILGFVLTMFTSFGAVLPVIFVCLVALASWLVYHLPRWIYAQFRRP